MMVANKRGKGEGSVYERADGRWFGSLSLVDANGKRVRRTVSGPDEATAQTKLDALRAGNVAHTIYLPEQLGEDATAKAREQNETLSEAVKPLIEDWVDEK